MTMCMGTTTTVYFPFERYIYHITDWGQPLLTSGVVVSNKIKVFCPFGFLNRLVCRLHSSWYTLHSVDLPGTSLVGSITNEDVGRLRHVAFSHHQSKRSLEEKDQITRAREALRRRTSQHCIAMETKSRMRSQNLKRLSRNKLLIECHNRLLHIREVTVSQFHEHKYTM